MYKKIVALTAVALYALLAFLAAVVTDFHDREFPQELGVESQIGIEFTESAISEDAALAETQRLNQEHQLGLYRLLPDLDDTGAQVFVDLSAEKTNESTGWFGRYEPAKIVGTERLENSPSSGTYLVTDKTYLDEAVKELKDQGVTVNRTDSAPLESVKNLVQASGFAAPVLAGCALIAAMTIFWLAIRARSRALRVLAGGVPWRIQLQDLGGFALILTGSAFCVAALGTLVVGVTRGWAYAPSFAVVLTVFECFTLAASLAVAVAMSLTAWPSVDLIARRLPAVKSLRWAAHGVQIVTLVILVAYTGPAWGATQNAQQNAAQLQAWNELSDQVQVAFGFEDQYFDAVTPQFSQLVKNAEKNEEAALSYTITEELWEGDFQGYSAITLVNNEWIKLMEHSVGKDALKPVATSDVENMLTRELGESFELWGGNTQTAPQILTELTVYEPSNGTAYPVADGGALGQLSFLNDVLVLEVPEIHAVFDDQNIASLASTGNIIFTGADRTQQRLSEAGLDHAGLDDIGVPGTMRTVYVAEQGILEAQFATYLASILLVSLMALALAFLVAAAVHAMISGLLNAHRDFPIRLTGVGWERVVRSRALRDAIIGAVIGAVFVITQPTVSASAITAAVSIAGIAAIYISHTIAASLIFTRVTHRKL